MLKINLKANLLGFILTLIFIALGASQLIPVHFFLESQKIIKLDYFLSFLLLPTISTFLIILYLFKKKCISVFKGYFRVILSATLFTSAILLSCMINQSFSKEVIVGALFFPIFTIFFVVITHVKYPFNFEGLVGCILIFWALTPFLFLLNLNDSALFLQLPCDWSGFAAGRLLNGYILGLTFLWIFFYKVNTNSLKVLWFSILLFIFFALVATRVKSSILAVLVCIYFFGFNQNSYRYLRKLCFVIFLGFITIFGSTLWDSACRNYLEKPIMLDYSQEHARWIQKIEPTRKSSTLQKIDITPANNVESFSYERILNKWLPHDGTRYEIYKGYLKEIQGNWLFGQGKFISLFIPGAGADGTGRYTQAHNLIIQVFANFGLIGLLAIFAWILAFYRIIKCDSSRALYVYLIIYSQFEPLFGGSTNIFSPAPALIFLAIGILESHAIDSGSNPHADQ